MPIQLAELYLRGSLVSKTWSNLTQEQKTQVEKRLDDLLNNKLLFGCRDKFCQILANTIGGDYKYKEAAINDYMIALTKGIVYILYHKPKPDIFNNNTELVKFFKQFVYQYMRQILNENRIPYSSHTNTFHNSPYIVAHKHIINILKNNNAQYTTDETSCDVITINTLKANNKIKKQILNASKKYRKHNIKITMADDNHIIIKNLSKHNTQKIKLTISSKIKINETSINHETNNIDKLMEHKASAFKEANNITNDTSRILSFLPDDLHQIYNLIVNTPEDFVNKFNSTTPTRTQMAQYLGVPLSEINNKMDRLKTYYCYYYSNTSLQM